MNSFKIPEVDKKTLLYLKRKMTDQEWDRVVTCRDRMASDFAKQYGWTVSKWFNLETLRDYKCHGGNTYPQQYGRFFDHCYYFKKDRRAVAIVAHMYDLPNKEKLETFSKEWKLSAVVLPKSSSWYLPDWTTPILWTAIDNVTTYRNTPKGGI